MKKGPYGPFFLFGVFANGDVPSPGNEGATPYSSGRPLTVKERSTAGAEMAL